MGLFLEAVTTPAKKFVSTRRAKRENCVNVVSCDIINFSSGNGDERSNVENPEEELSYETLMNVNDDEECSTTTTRRTTMSNNSVANTSGRKIDAYFRSVSKNPGTSRTVSSSSSSMDGFKQGDPFGKITDGLFRRHNVSNDTNTTKMKGGNWKNNTNPKVNMNYFSRSKNISESGPSCSKGDAGTADKTSNSVQQLSTSWEFIKLESRPIHDFSKINDAKDEPQDVAPPRFIKISDGRICLGPPKSCDSSKDTEMLEARIAELEEALKLLGEKVNNSQNVSPTIERDLKEQLETMNRAMKSKERKAMQACRDHKMLQARFARQETLLQIMQQENKALHSRVRQYEHCLDDVMRKVVDAIVAEDSLREEVSMLKSRVRDLEAQNAALTVNPAKGKDEGYCTMSSGQPQPSNGHLEDLPEEPEQWLNMSGEPCSAEMEDWSMSQEELGIITLDDEFTTTISPVQSGTEVNEHDWLWNSSGYLNSTMIDSQSEGISRLLQEAIVYSEDEEVACVDFTREFYKLVTIPSESTRSLFSYMDADTDDEDDDHDSEEDDDNNDEDKKDSIRRRRNRRYNNNNSTSPTPSEAGRVQVTSCSSSESEEQQIQQLADHQMEHHVNSDIQTLNAITTSANNEENTLVNENTQLSTKSEKLEVPEDSSWKRSNGWRKVTVTQPKQETHSLSESQSKLPQRALPAKELKMPPPVPIRRSRIS